MQAQHRQNQGQRKTSSGAYHGQKRALIGHTGPAPAWRPNASANAADAAPNARAGPSHAHAPAKEGGSKILLSFLPKDVGDTEVEELFAKTVGPTKDVFVVYNNKGTSKGLAVVTFQRAEDALKARKRFHGKIVDGKTPIKIEIVVDSDQPSAKAGPAPAQSLLARMGGIAPGAAPSGPAKPGRNPLLSVIPAPQAKAVQHHAQAHAQAQAHAVKVGKARTKKGPKRVRKQQQQQQQRTAAASAADLDREMDDYRALGKQAA